MIFHSVTDSGNSPNCESTSHLQTTIFKVSSHITEIQSKTFMPVGVALSIYLEEIRLVLHYCY